MRSKYTLKSIEENAKLLEPLTKKERLSYFKDISKKAHKKVLKVRKRGLRDEEKAFKELAKVSQKTFQKLDASVQSRYIHELTKYVKGSHDKYITNTQEILMSYIHKPQEYEKTYFKKKLWKRDVAGMMERNNSPYFNDFLNALYERGDQRTVNAVFKAMQLRTDKGVTLIDSEKLIREITKIINEPGTSSSEIYKKVTAYIDKLLFNDKENAKFLRGL